MNKKKYMYMMEYLATYLMATIIGVAAFIAIEYFLMGYFMLIWVGAISLLSIAHTLSLNRLDKIID